MNFVIKLIRYTKSKLVPIYVRSIFYFYKRLSQDYAHEKFLLLKANFKTKNSILIFLLINLEIIHIFIGRDIK